VTPHQERFPVFSVLSKEETERILGQYSPKDDLYAIRNWPDAKFTTSEGRTFLLFIGAKSIWHRLEAAAATMMKKPPQWEGAIFELDSDDEPFVFRTFDDAAAVWAQLHEAYRVPMTELECAFLDLEFPEDNDEE
jgi:hypothetical protein